jgi:pimeloyl-ACP methyl ester carboxylesterase
MERIHYEEFSMFNENAEEFGIEFVGRPAVRRVHVEVEPGRQLSALVWGDEPAEYVFLHGGGQNAHTWDTVALALGRPLVAIDLAGHGHSDLMPNGSALDLATSARDVASVIRQFAPDARAVVGMSLGGLTTLSLWAHAPDLVRRIVLVDVTPGVNAEKSRAISNFIAGPAGFDSFDDILARTIEHNPTRTVASLRRGVLHNALQLDDGTWVWRHARGRGLGSVVGAAADGGQGRPDFAALWPVMETVTVPLMLARGLRPQSVVDDADEAEVLRRCPGARIEHFAEAGHSIQGDTPVALAQMLEAFVTTS